MQEKGYHKKGENAAKSATDRSQVGTDMASCDAACACCATTDGADAHIECFTNAASNAHNQEPAQQPRLVHAPKHRMHIDWANSITLGRSKERYYLIIVIDSIDFTWAQPSTSRMEPKCQRTRTRSTHAQKEQSASAKRKYELFCDAQTCLDVSGRTR